MIRILGVFLFVVLVSSPAYAKILDIQEVVSDGGVKAWLVEDNSVPVLSIEFAFEGFGSAYDPENKQGLARMMANTMDEGAGSIKAKAFQKELRDLSISLSYSAGRDAFYGSLKTLSKNRARATELLKLSLNAPRFDKEAIERMRKANQSRIRSSLSDPEWMAARLLNDKAYEGHAYAQNSGGTLSSLERINSSELKKHHKNLGKNLLSISVTGDISSEELKPLLDDIFGELPEVSLQDHADIEIQNAGKVFIHEKDIPQSIIQILQNGVPSDSPKYQIAKVMNYILGASGFGSRLMKKIREKRGLTYGIYSYFLGLDHSPGLMVSTSTQNKNAAEMLSLIEGEFEKLKTTPVTAQELDDAKAYLIGSVPLSLTSTNKIAKLMVSMQLDGRTPDYLDQREAQIKAVTAEDIQALAKEVLTPESFTTIIVGKPEGIEDAERIQNLPNVE